MVIWHLISSQGYYGAENMLVSLARASWEQGADVRVAVLHDPRGAYLEVADQARRRGLPTVTIPCNGRWDRAVVSSLRQALDVGPVDVLHCHGYKADVYGWAACRRRSTALVATCHNWPSRRWRMQAYAALDRMVLRRFDAVAAPSEPVAQKLRQSGVREALYIPNGVKLEAFQNAEPTLRPSASSPDSRLVGFVGRMSPEKGGDVLLHAAAEVLRSRPETLCVFVGEGPSRADWEGLAQRLGLAGKVIFTGVRHDLAGVYASLHVLVLPSWTEAMPMCLLEAMASGCPVVATRVGSVPSLVLQEQTGLLVEPGEVEGLAVAIRRLLENPSWARQLAERARARVAERFCLDAMARAYQTVYERAALRAAARARGRRR